MRLNFEPRHDENKGISSKIELKRDASFSDGDFFSFTRHEPVGICGQVIPVSHCACVRACVCVCEYRATVCKILRLFSNSKN